MSYRENNTDYFSSRTYQSFLKKIQKIKSQFFQTKGIMPEDGRRKDA
jgi:hypothetical protein